MEGANALNLPFQHFYSAFVQVLGTNSLIFSRIEKHRALVTNADFDLKAEKPTESNWEPIQAEINFENYDVKWQIDLAFYEFSLKT